MSREIDIGRFIELLGSLWASKNERIQDYACNLYADKLATLDLLLDEIDDEELKKDLELIRNILKVKGEALWIMQADILTNLAIKTGMRSKVVRWRRQTG